MSVNQPVMTKGTAQSRRDAVDCTEPMYQNLACTLKQFPWSCIHLQDRGMCVQPLCLATSACVWNQRLFACQPQAGQMSCQYRLFGTCDRGPHDDRCVLVLVARC